MVLWSLSVHTESDRKTHFLYKKRNIKIFFGDYQIAVDGLVTASEVKKEEAEALYFLFPI